MILGQLIEPASENATVEWLKNRTALTGLRQREHRGTDKNDTLSWCPSTPLCYAQDDVAVVGTSLFIPTEREESYVNGLNGG